MTGEPAEEFGEYGTKYIRDAFASQAAVGDIRSWLATDSMATSIHDSRCGEGGDGCDCHVKTIRDILERWGVA